MSQSVSFAKAGESFPRNNIEPAQNVTLEHIETLYKFLQGELPEGVHIKPSPKLSQRRAFNVIYFLQEYLGIIPDNFDRCCKCGDIYNSQESGTYYRYRNYCDHCRPD